MKLTRSAFVLVLLSQVVSPAVAHADNTPPPTTVTIAGTFQDELGCPGSWQPDCAKTFLTYDAQDDTWKGTFHLPANTTEQDKPPRYKAALNGSWAENYGADAKRGGADIPLLLSASTTVKFYYDHKTHWVADSVNKVIAVVTGNFQAALGCARDDDPRCLRSWLEDPQGTGAYAFLTTALPAGTYEAKVAINENADDTYGQDGAKGGAPIQFTVKAKGDEIYFGYDPVSHKLLVSTAGAPHGSLSKAQAYWVARDTIVWPGVGSRTNKYFLHYDPAAGLVLAIQGITGGQQIPLTFAPTGAGPAILAKFPQLAGDATLKLDPADVAKVPEILKGQVALTAWDANGKLLDATTPQIPGVLDDLYTYHGPLGVTYTGVAPTLRLWAPTARSARLHLFDDSHALISQTVSMTADPASGVWTAAGTADWTGKYYLYEVEVYVPRTGKFEHNLVTDPYSISLSMNSTRSQIVNLDDPSLKPPGWDAVQKHELAAPEDIVLYELHIRDFSINDQGVPAADRGTYMAFTHSGSDGMRHLADLAKAGLTHVHLLPAFDIASVNEDKSTWQRVDEAALGQLPPDSDQQQAAVNAIKDRDGFNWGYDPYHYDAPDGAYATNPDGPMRIVEFRSMVQALNTAGLRVVMDVVYNHTNASGQDEKSVLDKVVPGYYHRLDADGNVQTSTCCQDTATEHAMMEKLMIDSLRTWATAYKVDGFRFDLMGHHMLSNMVNARAALDALTPAQSGVDGKQIYMYGEGWDFGEVADNALGKNASQLNIGGAGIGVFNDRLRDAARGGSPFTPPTDQGFLTGLFTDPNGSQQGLAADQRAQLLKYSDWIRVGLAGNLKDYTLVDAAGIARASADIDYNGKPAGYTLSPQENIVYVSAHDNESLFDAIQWKAAITDSLAERVRMQNLGASLVLLSQGVPFFQAGDELLRSKSLDGNSYNSGDWFNRLDFTYRTDNWGVGLPPNGTDRWPAMKSLLANPSLKPGPADIQSALSHFKEMLQIRRSSQLFRLRTADEVKQRLKFYNTGPQQVPGLIVMSLENTGAGRLADPFDRVVVVFNATPQTQTFANPDLASAAFVLHPVLQNSSDPVVKTSTYDAATGTFSVPERTAAIFVMLSQAPATTATPPAATATAFSATPTTVAATQAAPTPPAVPTIAPTAAPADTTQSTAAVVLIWAVIIIAVAITVFLVWRTRPGRKAR
jgi:pullulanase